MMVQAIKGSHEIWTDVWAAKVMTASQKEFTDEHGMPLAAPIVAYKAIYDTPEEVLRAQEYLDLELDLDL